MEKLNEKGKRKYYNLDNMMLNSPIRVIIAERDFGRKCKESELKNILDKKG